MCEKFKSGGRRGGGKLINVYPTCFADDDRKSVFEQLFGQNAQFIIIVRVTTECKQLLCNGERSQ